MEVAGKLQAMTANGLGILGRARDRLLANTQASLLRWFALTGAVSTLLVTILQGSVLTMILTRMLIEHDAEAGREYVQSVADAQGIDSHFHFQDGRPSQGIGVLNAIARKQPASQARLKRPRD